MGESQEKKREGKDEESKDRRGWNLAENAVRKGKKSLHNNHNKSHGDMSEGGGVKLNPILVQSKIAKLLGIFGK